MHKILILPGDGIGTEIINQAVKVLKILKTEFGLNIETEFGLIGGEAYDAEGTPLSDATVKLAQKSDAVLLGAVGGHKWESLDIAVRPEKGLLKIRSELDLFANLRPAILYPQLASASSLKYDLVVDLDIMIVRELTSGIYFGQPRGITTNSKGEREGFNTLRYSESEITRIAHVAFKTATQRNQKLTSVDKANVLETTEMWREIVTNIGKQYPEVTIEHIYVDNAAMQLVKAPKQFDTLVTTNMFGDILSDCAAMLTGSIGMLPSASLDSNNKGMYEPIHGSAPDIAGKNVANPLATILSVAMLVKYSLGNTELCEKIESAVKLVLDQNLRTADIHTKDNQLIGTEAMGDAVVLALKSLT